MKTKLQRGEQRRAPVQLILPLSGCTSEIKRRAWFQNTRVYFRLPSAEATQRQLFFMLVSLFLDRPEAHTPCHCRQAPSAVRKDNQSLFFEFTTILASRNGAAELNLRMSKWRCRLEYFVIRPSNGHIFISLRGIVGSNNVP